VRLIDAWVNGVARRSVVAGQGTLAPPVVNREALNFADERGTDAGGQQAATFTYTLPSGRIWWWKADIDYGCIETQAEPATRAVTGGEGDNDAVAINAIITTHIFSLATSLHVSPHAEVGGGHLSLDRRTTFGDNARWLRNFLVLYANDPNRWRAEDIDAFNAPMIAELKPAGRTAFRAAIVKFDTKWNNPPQMTITDFVNELKTNVFKAAHFADPESDEQAAADDKRKGQPAHYQATNVEHVTDPTAAKQRIEMRRFDAQTGLEDLLDNIDALVTLATECRRPGLVALRNL
jgi:hypothetical protein